MDDEREAQQLIDDLATLVDAGLIVPLRRHGELCFAVVEPDDFAA